MPYKKRMISVTTKVNEDKYEQFRAAAGDKTVAEWVRQVLDGELERTPFELKLMADLWALRYVVLNGLSAVAADPKAALASIEGLHAEAEQKKADKARTILGRTQ